MEILFNDLGFDTRQKRTDYLILRNIGVNYLDEMTVRQAQIVISELVERRGNGRVQDAEAHAYGRPNGECDDGPDDGLPF